MEEKQVIWHIAGLNVNSKTMIMTWIVMVFLLILGYFAGRGARMRKPGGVANIFEFVIDFIKDMIKTSIDYKKGGPLLSILVTLIMFVFFSNMLGLIPNFTFGLFGHLVEGPSMMSPTADLNTTLALAVFINVLAIVWAIKWRGLAYFKHYKNPLELVELAAKPVTMSFRLYGNIFAGEMLVATILSLSTVGIAGFLGGLLPNVVWLAFSIFVGTIQAFVFTILSVVYISQAIGSDEGH